MKRLFFVTVFALTAHSAFAVQLRCSFNLKRGGHISYHFERSSEMFYAEAYSETNGKITVNPLGGRSLWIGSQDRHGFFFLRLMHPPAYLIGIAKGGFEGSGEVIRKDALLMRGKMVIGYGGCGFAAGEVGDGQGL